ncbi:hypothetical protein PHYSODRAFT_512468, partial [Phytophthora sojae]
PGSCMQRFRFRTSKTVKARNSKVHDPADKVPESFEHYARRLECIHAGKYKLRETGKRLRQQSCQIECPAQINACVRRVGTDPSRWVVCVTKIVVSLEHNHPVSESLFKHHPRTRLSIPDEVVHTVSIVQKAGAKKKTIHQYILENCDRLHIRAVAHKLAGLIQAGRRGAQSGAPGSSRVSQSGAATRAKTEMGQS